MGRGRPLELSARTLTRNSEGGGSEPSGTARLSEFSVMVCAPGVDLLALRWRRLQDADGTQEPS